MTVRYSLRRFRQIAWVALFAILVNVLAPGVSHALVAVGVLPADTIEICTPSGIERLSALDADSDPEDGALAQTAAACAYCMVHAASFGLPPSGDRGHLPQHAAPPLTFLPFATSTPARAWVVHIPRAPPATI